jgi:hypothetical protein
MLPKLLQLTRREAQAYDVLVDLVPSGSPVDEEGFSKLAENPKDEIAKRNSWGPSVPGKVLAGLKEKGLYDATRLGSHTWEWSVKLPDDGQAAGSQPEKQQLTLDTEDTSPGTDVLALIGQLEDQVRRLVAENAELREAANTAELLRTDNERLAAEKADLRAQHDQVIQTLGQLDEDVLRAIIKNAQKTQGA